MSAFDPPYRTQSLNKLFQYLKAHVLQTYTGEDLINQQTVNEPRLVAIDNMWRWSVFTLWGVW